MFARWSTVLTVFPHPQDKETEKPDISSGNEAVNEKTNIPPERYKKEKADLELAAKGMYPVSLYSDTETPDTIKLYITASNKKVDLGFDEYAKCVLPNEWYPTWKSESLKAGAVAIKTYAWYNATHPRNPAKGLGCDLTDKSENYQHYVANSNQDSTDKAVDAVSGIFMVNSDGVVFEPPYGRGTRGEAGTAFSGKLSQWGTQYLAENYPEHDYTTILSYYYSLSNISKGYISVGYY